MKRHELDPLSLVFGIAFLALGLALLGGWSLFDPSWGRIGPLVVIVLGVGLGVAVLAGGRRGRSDDAGLSGSDEERVPDANDHPSRSG